MIICVFQTSGIYCLVLPELHRSKPLNLMPQPFQAPTLFDAGGVPGQSGPSSEKPPGSLPAKEKEPKEKKEKRPPKAKTVEQEAKAVSW